MSPARQLELAFEDAPRWDAPSLETTLAREAGNPLRLVLTDNRSVLLSFKREAGCLLLRLHRMFHEQIAACEAKLDGDARRALALLPKLRAEYAADEYVVRVRNRCKVCGRPRGYIRRFQLYRICFREMALKGLIPGVVKSSW